MDRHPDGLIDPNAVARLMRDDDPDLHAQRFSGMWCAAGGREHGFLDRTDIPVQLDGATSKGNSNKSTVYRRWRPGAPRTT
ncbi:hypothetical protein GCM10009737_07870 [Nocardioides lentus]|uniref:EF-hand domain-containing protein n=2 Tax=Nocardioides lentus TaxID=338077 RepID=A0ABP5AD39_9ACTN